MWFTTTAGRKHNAANLAWAVGAVIAVTLVASSAQSAQPIDINARTSLSLSLDARGLELVANGTLRDNSGAGLARRPVLLSYVREGADSPTRMDTVRTNGAGQFQTTHRLDEGQWQVVAEFGGEAFLAPSEANASTSLALLRATLIGAPPTVVSAAEASFSFSLTAEFMGAALTGDAISVVSDGADVVEHAPGQWVASVHDLTRPAVTLVAIADPGGAGQPGRAEWRIRRAFNPRVAAQAVDLSTSFLQPRDVRVAATVTDITGPIPGMSTRLIVEDIVVATGVSDADGLVNMHVAEHTGRAAVSVSLPSGQEVARASVELPAPRAMPKVSGGVFLGLALALLLVVVVSWARELRPLPPAQEITQARGGAAEPISLELAPEPEQSDALARFVGKLVDAETGLRVDATLVLDGVLIGLDERGGFEVAAGDWDATAAIRASAPGYRPVEASVAVPSTGRHVVIRLTPMRLELVNILADAVKEVTPADVDTRSWWGKATVREVWQATAESVRGLQRVSTRSTVSRIALDEVLESLREQPRRHEAAEALGRLVERGYFGAEPVTQADIELAQRLAGIVTEGRA